MSDRDKDKEVFQSNKDVIINLMERIDDLEVSLQETDRIIRKYNGLRENIEEVNDKQSKIDEQVCKNRDKINEIIVEKNTELSLLQRLGKYSGWLLGILSFIAYLIEVGILL